MGLQDSVGQSKRGIYTQRKLSTPTPLRPVAKMTMEAGPETSRLGIA